MHNLKTIIDMTMAEIFKFQKDMKMSQNLWKDGFKSNLLGSFGRKIVHTLNDFLTDVHRLDPVPPTLTNPWFKKYFIRGSSLIKNQSKALEPLNPISVSIQTLEKEWLDFRRSIRRDFDVKNVNRTALVLHNLENLVQNQTISYDEILKSESGKLEKCVFQHGKNFYKLSENYEAEETKSTTNEVWEVLDNIHDTLRMAFTNDPIEEGISQEVARTCLNFAMQKFYDSSNSHYTKPSTLLKLILLKHSGIVPSITEKISIRTPS
ncbi:hypothetical protein L3Y34_019102 [Caenorhabditis briggsae]|uniref:Uncharacterized protein n=1 Tax=Caenorhabditis briggsae TaxID=6238 RepID=A0AAE9DN71_CAEBR|nr:hypothetical protein L3Y34_019102 [Caenorhabditis briggsae]